MIQLPNGCKCSEIKVLPKNWETTKLINSNWKIYYRFYDPNHPNKPEWGKLITVKGMNSVKDLELRKTAVKQLLKEELHLLKSECYNPIDKLFKRNIQEEFYELPPETLFSTALDMAFQKLEIGHNTKIDIKNCLIYFKQSLFSLNYSHFKIEEVKRRHIRAILQHLSMKKKYSNNRYNKVRANIMSIFKILVDLDALDYNPVNDIPKKKTVKNIREQLTDEEVKEVKKHLKETNYEFYRYCEIFYFSGSRSSELMNIQIKHIDLVNQIFKVLVKKGRGGFEWQTRPINNKCLHLWAELCRTGAKQDYLFSKGLVPGVEKISERQITIRWKRHVKDKLGITVDFYAWKHRHTTKVIDLYGQNLASGLNGHKSGEMNKKHYDLHRQNRILEEGKNANIDF